MVRSTRVSVCLVVLAWLALGAGDAFAQVTSTITGSARDATGGVLPGVTVEVSSPALIEKVRVVTTDGQGIYRVIDLRPGTYTVVFTLPGFNTFRRDGLDLPAGFTATVNAEMRVGSLEETITVSGAAPLVDTQTVQQRRTLDSEIVESLPATLRAPAAYVVFLPGVIKPPAIEPSRDLRRISIHGSRVGDSIEALDGAQYPLLNGGGGFPAQYYFNAGNIQEITVDTSGLSIENLRGGMVTNIIPKEGANQYHADFVVVHSNEDFVQNNLTSELKAKGLNAVNQFKNVWDYNASWGGALKQDKLWFWNSFRYWGDETYQANVFYNATPAPAWRYTPDLSRQYVQESTFKSASLRLTWQANQKHKFSVFYDRNPVCICDRADNDEGAVQSPESTDFFHVGPNYLAQVNWTSPMTNRLFLEATVQKNYNQMSSQMQPGFGNDFNTIAAYDSAVNVYYRSTPRFDVISLGPEPHNSETYRAAASYVTGSPTVKFGINVRHGLRYPNYTSNGGSISVETDNFVPSAIVQIASPFNFRDRLNADGGIFAGDQWQIKRLTLNYGARYEFLRASVDAQSMPAGPFVPARSYPQVKDTPNWKDGTVRLAAAYDVFGDGNTAIKGSWGKYVIGEQLALADLANPIARTITTTTRDWNDANRNFNIDCVLTNPQANGECGQIDNLNFGLNDPDATVLDADLYKGSGKRLYQWEQSVQLAHQVTTGIAVNFGYFRRTYHNFRVTENMDVTPAEFQAFSVVAPADPRLPGGGGYTISGLYDVVPAKFGEVTNHTTLEKRFGKRTEVYDGLDLTTTVRWQNGMNVQGGLNMGRTALNTCFAVDSPQARDLKIGNDLVCDQAPPFQPSVKFLGVVPLPIWGLQVGAAFQSVPGPQITASMRFPRASVIGLGRPLNQSRTGNVPLLTPGTMYNDRITTVDGRITKEFRLRNSRIQASLDAYNLFNSSAVIAHNNAFGSAWLNPQAIVTGRWLKVTARVVF